MLCRRKQLSQNSGYSHGRKGCRTRLIGGIGKTRRNLSFFFVPADFPSLNRNILLTCRLLKSGYPLYFQKRTVFVRSPVYSCTTELARRVQYSRPAWRKHEKVLPFFRLKGAHFVFAVVRRNMVRRCGAQKLICGEPHHGPVLVLRSAQF